MNKKKNHHIIKAVNEYVGLPLIVKSDTGKIFQLSYVDASGKLRKYKQIKPKSHLGGIYYRINKHRYSEYHLSAIEKRKTQRINLNTKIIG